METSSGAKPELHLVNSHLPSLVFNIEDFLYAKSVWRERTVKFYEVPLRLYVDHVDRHFWPPTDSSINSFLAAARRRGCQEYTIFNYYRALKTWLTWLYRRGRIEYNPIDLIEKPPQPKPIPRAPDKTDIKRLFDYLEEMAQSEEWIKLRDLALLSLALDTGMREGEIARLKLADIDPYYRSITIQPESKNHRGRVVKFSSLAAMDLNRWLEKRSILTTPASLGNVFIALGGKRLYWHALTESGIAQVLKRKLRQAKVDHFRFHSLRNAYAIYSLARGAELDDVRKQMGHANLATTALYTLTIDRGRGERHEKTSPRGNLGKSDSP